MNIQKDILRKGIGFFELITGIFGVIIVVSSTVALGPEFYGQENFMLQIFMAVILYGSLGWAGFLSIRENKKAFRMSVTLQIMQIPVFAVKGLQFKFGAAAFFCAGIQNRQFFFHPTIKPIDFALNSNPVNYSFYGIYLVPIIVFILLLKSRKK